MQKQFSEKKEIEEEISEVIPYRYEITSYGADYTVDGLVRRMNDESIFVPSFQRAYVWNYNQAARFVESLLLGLPVPGIFLSREYDSQKLLIIDGQQRLSTLQYFYNGIFKPSGRRFALKNVQPELEGATYETLSIENKRRLSDSIIHATIVKQDQPSEDNSSIYYIFERLNTSGTLLQPQEIRSCIFHGKFRDLLHSLNDNQQWRAIYGGKSRRIRDEELILRFFALHYEGERYSEPMKNFLNRFMGRNRQLTPKSADEFTCLFDKTISLAYDAFGKEAFKYKKYMSASIFDSVMVGLSKRLDKGNIRNKRTLRDVYINLLANEEYLSGALEATGSKKNVETRLRLAIEAFADVP